MPKHKATVQIKNASCKRNVTFANRIGNRKTGRPSAQLSMSDLVKLYSAEGYGKYRHLIVNELRERLT